MPGKHRFRNTTGLLHSGHLPLLTTCLLSILFLSCFWHGRSASPNLVPASGLSAICMALERGHESCAFLLLEAGADLSAKSPSGCSPLLLAAFDGREALVVEMLKQAPAVNTRNDNGCTPLFVAAQGTGSQELVHPYWSFLQCPVGRLVCCRQLFGMHRCGTNHDSHLIGGWVPADESPCVCSLV